MSSLLFALPGNDELTAELAAALAADVGRLEIRDFPDGEAHLRFGDDLGGRDVILVCTLDRPNAKFLPLAFAADTARELGANSVGLVAPYLAYMRQDRQFEAGDAVTAPIFAKLVSGSFDWMVTVDPHLHRIHHLEQIYTIPARAMHAARLIADWIADNVPDAVLIGPDDESAQWVEAVARDAGKPFTVLTKIRHGDRDVEVSIPDIERWREKTPVLVDDIISTGRTMAATLGHLADAKMKPAVCIGVHAVFADGAYEALKAGKATRIVTANTIPHASNGIDVAELLAEGVRSVKRGEAP